MVHGVNRQALSGRRKKKNSSEIATAAVVVCRHSPVNHLLQHLLQQRHGQTIAGLLGCRYVHLVHWPMTFFWSQVHTTPEVIVSFECICMWRRMWTFYWTSWKPLSLFSTDVVAIINYHQGTKTHENFRSFWKLRDTAWLSGCEFVLVWILHDWGVQFGEGAIFWFPVQHMKMMAFQKGPATRNFPPLGLGFTSN